MVVCLSPNGRSQSRSEGPATTILVGSVKGVYRLERLSAASRWLVSGPALEGKHISALLHEPASDLLFAGAHFGGGLYVSGDGGRSWEERTDGLGSKHVYTIAAQTSPAGDVVLYAGTEPAALYRSLDLGRSWQELPALHRVSGTELWSFPPPPHIAHLKNLTFDPRDAAVVYACVEQGALLKSRDGGETWVEIESYATAEDAQYKDIHRIVFSPADPDVLYMNTGVGLYRSPDAGATWQHLTTSTAPVGYPDALFVDPQEASTVYIGGAGGSPATWEGGVSKATVMRSRDSGETWEEFREGLPRLLRGNIEAMSLHEWPDEIALYAATATGEVYASERRDSSWQLIASGLPAVSKAGHYRRFLSAEERQLAEAAMSGSAR
jgi:photosystem II stability/assembly factor-like uncharacterized protein